MPPLLLAFLLLSSGVCARADVLPTLNESALHDAVAVSRSKAERVREFLRGYQQPLEEKAATPFATRVEIFTPFRMAVERAWHTGDTYSFFQAREEYNPKNDRLGIQVTILLPSGYILNRATPLGTDWVIRPQQGEKLLAEMGRSRRELYALGFGYEHGTLIGVEIRADFDIRTIETAAPLSVEIISPEGRIYRACFHLAELR